MPVHRADREVQACGEARILVGHRTHHACAFRKASGCPHPRRRAGGRSGSTPSRRPSTTSPRPRRVRDTRRTSLPLDDGGRARHREGGECGGSGALLRKCGVVTVGPNRLSALRADLDGGHAGRGGGLRGRAHDRVGHHSRCQRADECDVLACLRRPGGHREYRFAVGGVWTARSRARTVVAICATLRASTLGRTAWWRRRRWSCSRPGAAGSGGGTRSKYGSRRGAPERTACASARPCRPRTYDRQTWPVAGS